MLFLVSFGLTTLLPHPLRLDIVAYRIMLADTTLCKMDTKCLEHGRREGEGAKDKGEKDVLCAFCSILSPYFGWLATNFCTCSRQMCLEISCDKHEVVIQRHK